MKLEQKTEGESGCGGVKKADENDWKLKSGETLEESRMWREEQVAAVKLTYTFP